jgi:hypothetical protein
MHGYALGPATAPPSIRALSRLNSRRWATTAAHKPQRFGRRLGARALRRSDYAHRRTTERRYELSPSTPISIFYPLPTGIMAAAISGRPPLGDL